MKLPEVLTIRREHFNRDLIGKVVVVFVFLGPILVPLLWLSGWPLFTTIAQVGWNFGRAICSDTVKSFTIGGEPMMICARCFGVGTGLLVTGLIYHYTPLIRPRVPNNRLYLATIIAVLFIPWLIDSGAQRLGLSESNVLLMFPTGFLGGVALVLAPLLFWPLEELEKLEDDQEMGLMEITEPLILSTVGVDSEIGELTTVR